MQKKPKIIFNFEKRKWENLFLDDIGFWEKVYPDIDVLDLVTNKMVAWIDGNPNRAKKNWKRFIVNWLSSAQHEKDRLKR